MFKKISPRLLVALLAVAAIAGAGTAYLGLSGASTPVVSTEPETGSLAGGVANVNDSTASASNAVKFGKRYHFASGTNSNQSLATSLGFNMMDVTGSTTNPATTKSIVDALPNGVVAMVWVGNLDNAPAAPCPSPGFSDTQFQALVNGLAGDSKVFGYYLSDEPHPVICPSAAPDIKARADYIRAHDAHQKSFIVILDGSNQCGTNLGCEYSALAPANTDVDYIGLDPYPCHYSGTTAVPCDNTKITSSFNTAVASGINAKQIVPTYQTFGQEGRTDGKTIFYRLPSTDELTSMLTTWDGLDPQAAFDYSYTFGIQCTVSSCPAPQTLANNPALQQIIAAHNK